EQLHKRTRGHATEIHGLLFHLRMLAEILHPPPAEPFGDVLADAADADNTDRPADHQGPAVFEFLPAAVSKKCFVELEALEQRNHETHGGFGHAQIVLGCWTIAA